MAQNILKLLISSLGRISFCFTETVSVYSPCLCSYHVHVTVYLGLYNRIPGYKGGPCFHRLLSTPSLQSLPRLSDKCHANGWKQWCHSTGHCLSAGLETLQGHLTWIWMTHLDSSLHEGRTPQTSTRNSLVLAAFRYKPDWRQQEPLSGVYCVRRSQKAEKQRVYQATLCKFSSLIFHGEVKPIQSSLNITWLLKWP